MNQTIQFRQSPVDRHVVPRGGRTSTATPPVSPNTSTRMPRRHPKHQPTSFPSPALSLLSVSSSASSAVSQRLGPSFPRRLRPSQTAKSFARASSTSTSPPLPLLRAGKAALPSSELSSSPEFCRAHRQRGQASLLHHFFQFLFLELPLDSLMLGVNLN